jgi:hypothetical protein
MWFYEKKGIKKPKKEKIHKLVIYTKDMGEIAYENPNFRQLGKIHLWFLLRSSPKYFFQFRNGSLILLRDQILATKIYSTWRDIE